MTTKINTLGSSRYWERKLLLGAASGLVLSLSSGLMAQAQETAGPEAEAAEDDALVQDTVVVRAIRDSLSSSQAIKQNADTVVDAITAEDIGALPDRSVAEALQRVPGINITRFAKPSDPDRFSVEGSGVILRGLPFVRSELNGRDVFSATGGRVLSFNDVSPELLGKVEVFKNSTADMVDGGISGTVNLGTRKPLDSSDPVFAGTIEGNYGDLAEEWSPAYSFLASDKLETRYGTFGGQIGFAKSELISRADNTQITDPCYRDPSQIGIYAWDYTDAQKCFRINPVNDQGVVDAENFDPSTFPPAGAVIVPQGAGARTTTFDRDREALSLVGQWESPERTMLITAEYLKAEADQLLSEHAILARVNGNQPAQPAFGTDWLYDSSGDFLAGQLTNTAWRGEANCGNIFAPNFSIDPAGSADFPCQPQVGFLSEMLRFEQERSTSTEDMSLNFKWDPTPQLSLNFDIQNIKSDVTEDSIIVATNTFQDIYVDLRPDVPVVEFRTPSTADGSSQGPLGVGFATNPDFTEYGFALDSRIRNEAEMTAFRADGAYDLADGAGIFRSVRFGARWAERDRVTRDTNFSNWGALSAPWGGCCGQFGSGQAFNSIYASDIPTYVSPTSPFNNFQGGNSPSPMPQGLYWGGGAGSLINAYQNGTFQQQAGEVVDAWEALTFAAGGYVIPGWRDVSSRAGTLNGGYFRDAEISNVTEKTRAIYGRADFEIESLFGTNMTLDGNIGARYVETRVESGGELGFPTLDVDFPFQTDLSTSCTPAAPGSQVPAVCELSPARLAEFLSIATGGTVVDDADIKFENWLPSFNAKLQVTDEILFRAGISKGIFRPDLASYRTGGTIGSNLEALRNEGTLETGPMYTIRTGNRLLEATESWNYDLTAEWYFDDVGSLTLALFQKNIEGIETGGVTLRNITNDAGNTYEVLVSGPSNDGEATLRGYEIGYQQTYDMLPGLFGNLGVQASYTYVDGDDFSNTVDVNVTRQSLAGLQPFAGVSEDTINLAGFYEDDRFSARLAYNWRSAYLVTARDDIFPYSPIWVEDTGQLDGSFFYTVNDKLKVGIQAVNLLDEVTETSQVLDFDGTRRPRSFIRNDRRYTVSARFNF